MNYYRILLVDNEIDLSKILKISLVNAGYKVDIAYSAQEALMKDLSIYNLLLLDISIGEMSGFKFAKIIRNDPKTSLIPIIFLSANKSENDCLTAFATGADDYITKPFSILELIARVSSVIRRVDSRKKNKLIRRFRT